MILAHVRTAASLNVKPPRCIAEHKRLLLLDVSISGPGISQQNLGPDACTTSHEPSLTHAKRAKAMPSMSSIDLGGIPSSAFERAGPESGSTPVHSAALSVGSCRRRAMIELDA